MDRGLRWIRPMRERAFEIDGGGAVGDGREGRMVALVMEGDVFNQCSGP